MTNQLYLGDCLEILDTFEENSIDTCITDPPYELGFMGKKWDSSGIAFQPETWQAVYRVLKPGALLLAFGGTRTYHRIACALEGRDFIGIEKEPDYYKIAEKRIAYWSAQPKLL